MFTSRAEYRLILRQDNADLRLSDIGHEVGLVADSDHAGLQRKRLAIQSEIKRLENTRVGSESLAQILSRPDVSYSSLPTIDASLSHEVIQQVEIEIKYSGYIERQGMEVEKFRSMEDKRIPEKFNYESIPGLRTESRLKLQSIRPATLGQASRISGVSPADISLVMVWMKRV